MRIIPALIICVVLAACQNTTDPKTGELFDSRKSSLKAIAERAKSEGNVQAAAQLEGQIIELDRTDANSFINLAKSLRKMGQKQEAANLLETGIDLNAENLKGKDAMLTELAITLIQLNDPAAALGRLSLVQSAKTRDFYNSTGVALDMTKKHAEAQNAYKDGLKISPKDDILLNNLALSYVLDKKYKDGITILEGLVKRPGAKPKHRQNLALAYGMMAQPDKALDMLLKDMTRKEAEENLEYYKNLRTQN